MWFQYLRPAIVASRHSNVSSLLPYLNYGLCLIYLFVALVFVKCLLTQPILNDTT